MQVNNNESFLIKMKSEEIKITSLVDRLRMKAPSSEFFYNPTQLILRHAIVADLAAHNARNRNNDRRYLSSAFASAQHHNVGSQFVSNKISSRSGVETI